MASGVGINDQCLDIYQELKLKHKYKYITFKLNDAFTEVVVDQAVENGTYDDFVGTLQETECRYAVFDFDYEKEGEGKRNKIIFISWIPGGSKLKARMVYASSLNSFAKTIEPQVQIQANDFDDIDYSSVLDKINRV
jgi:cofilin